MRITRHETRLLWPLGLPWARKDSTNKNRRPDRRTSRTATASLPTISRHFPLFPGKKYCPATVSLPVSRSRWASGQAPFASPVLSLQPMRSRAQTLDAKDVKYGFGRLFDLARAEPFAVASLHFSPRGEAKCVRGPSGRDASRLARAGVLEQYVEHGKQAQRSPGARIVCFDRRVVRNAGLAWLAGSCAPGRGIRAVQGVGERPRRRKRPAPREDR